MIHSGRGAIEAYYRERAPEYDAYYARQEYRADLAWLRSWVSRHVSGKTVLEVAAGTGYWTEVAARHATEIMAIDCNIETLNIAKKRSFGCKVSFCKADTFALPFFSKKFDVGIAFLWWSHVRKEKYHEFLSHLLSRLQPKGKLLIVDELYIPNQANDIICGVDRHGNRHELRILASGAVYEIIKNFPSRSNLRRHVAEFCNRITVNRLDHFWALSARTKYDRSHYDGGEA